MCLTSQKPLPWYLKMLLLFLCFMFLDGVPSASISGSSKIQNTVVAGSHLRPVKCHVAFWQCKPPRTHALSRSHENANLPSLTNQIHNHKFTNHNHNHNHKLISFFSFSKKKKKKNLSSLSLSLSLSKP